MPSDRNLYQHRQRRRAIIAWICGAIVVVLIAVGAIFGGDDKEGGFEHPSPFGYRMTAAQYEALEPGLDQVSFVNRLEQTGVPENLTQPEYVELFPPHNDEITCSYWEISDELGRIARICFSSPQGLLVEKLERSVSEEHFGVTA